MAIHKKKTPKREAQLGFESLSIEGGLLSPEWLSQVAQLAAGAQTDADYCIPKGLNVRDEIGRYWRIAQAHWSEFTVGRAGNADARTLAERFVQGFLRQSLGFGTLVQAEPVVIDNRSYPIGFSALEGRVPVIIAPAGLGLDALSQAFGDVGRRRSAFGLAQEYLNAASGALWGLANDGLSLRILRDNASLTRPAWIDVDLSRMFTEERYADFAALWLLAHESRFGRADQPVTDCALEIWRNAGREEGTRAREHLRRGVEDALIALGQGFVAHPENQQLRAALQNGSLSTKAYFNQLLRLVYRLIFLLTVEERGLLHPEGVDEKARALYASGYGIRRLRDRSVKRSAHDRFSDLWESTKIVLRALAIGESRLGLPALAGIFAKTQCPDLDTAKLENRSLLHAVFKLGWLRVDTGLSRVNWRDMGPEELGSVYESLLELVPQITHDSRAFKFASGAETRGNARKTSGSYYTPDSLVQVLLDGALEPVIADTIAKNPEKPVDALLGLSIVDPACGSGHFLLAAARRLAAHLARHQANGTPSAGEYRHALRQVVGRCIYGVDLNPMAVELCKVSLWMEAVEPGLPLTFLNSHIQHGNALLGTTPELMSKGIPDAAWDPIEGDDKKVAGALKKRNKKHTNEQQLVWTFVSGAAHDETAKVESAVGDLESASDENSEALAKKESQWDGILGSVEYRHQKLAADAWCAAFVWPKMAGELADAAPTNEVWRLIRDGQGGASPAAVNTVKELSELYSFFHWHLQFPHVFAKGGFDVVLGNPPWDQIQLDAREWFATRHPEITNAQHQAARTKALRELATSDPSLYGTFVAAQRLNEGIQAYVHQSGRYPLSSRGRLNTSTLFVEAACHVVREHGIASQVVPTGLATDSFTQEFFRYLVDSGRLHHLFSFENEEHLFPGVHNATRFCLLKIGGTSRRATSVQLIFYARQVAHVRETERMVSLTSTDFRLLNPNSATCPTFRWRRDAELNRRIYCRVGVFVRDDVDNGNPWSFRGLLMFMMNTDSHRFRTRAQMDEGGNRLVSNAFHGPGGLYLPLMEGKMIFHFDHRFGTYEGATEANLNKGFLPQLSDEAHADPEHTTLPEYWVPAADVDQRLQDRWAPRWFVGWRDITGVEKQRTIVAAVIPRHAVGHTMPLMMVDSPVENIAALYANMCSFVLDYAARQKVGGTHLTYSYLKQLPILPPNAYEASASWASAFLVRTWLLARVLELTYTAWDLEPFASDVGYNGPPFHWDPKRRFLLRCELDAAFFHLYEISRDNTDYVMDTFPIVRKNDEKAHGEYRTKRVILEIYDEMTEAARTGKPYQTRLDPPPADRSVAHPDTRGAKR